MNKCYNNYDYYAYPMKIMDRLASVYNTRICYIIDVDYKICIWIRGIDKLKNKKYLSNLEGRGYTYRAACLDYIKKLMDKSYLIRFNKKTYATTTLRNVVRHDNIYKKIKMTEERINV